MSTDVPGGRVAATQDVVAIAAVAARLGLPSQLTADELAALDWRSSHGVSVVRVAPARRWLDEVGRVRAWPVVCRVVVGLKLLDQLDRLVRFLDVPLDHLTALPTLNEWLVTMEVESELADVEAYANGGEPEW